MPMNRQQHTICILVLIFFKLSRGHPELLGCQENMTTVKKRAAVSFTGGKDCHLAMERALTSGDYEIVCLVVFASKAHSSRAHPDTWKETQAKALGLPLQVYHVDKVDDCYKKGYAQAIITLHDKYKIDTLITGDIDYVGNATSNFMTDVCKLHVPHVTVWLPLWHAHREDLLREMMVERQFRMIFSCVKTPLDETWIGRTLDQDAVQEIKAMGTVDLSGENGEYHTMVVWSPSYQFPLKLVFDQSAAAGPAAQELTDLPFQNPAQRVWVCNPTAELRVDSLP